ncbi:protease B nonderepressible form [Knufia obscura]|uniref:Protein PBN1 n=1 Tax=Knufia obscura TaxID=1635080 RepID=A0ABR0RVQ3_9EURO|nr:protease B nonderepressible form [Knufia obscura]
MRRRSTFIPSPGFDYDPSKLKIDGRHLSFAGLKAAREERLTLGLNELPAEVVEVLQKSHELHVRWVSSESYNRSSPYFSSLTPGLHVHYTPSAEGDEPLCPLLQTLYSPSLRCSTANATFTRPDILSERFATSAALQYYSLLPSLKQCVAWIQRNICSSQDVICKHNAALLNITSYVDIDYDSISHALTITAYWSKPPAVLMDSVAEWTTYDHWNMALDASPNDKNEVGLLQSAPASEPSEIGMEGFLAVVGEDSEPKPVMFSFPSRHHSLATQQAQDQKYAVTFDLPTGLHPTMRISLPTRETLQEPTNKPADSTCALHTYVTLPSVLFADEYAFPTDNHDPLFTEVHNILSLRSYSGERDLEAPDYVIQKWGSALLLELATPQSALSRAADSPWDITIPLHLRYLEPTAGGQQSVEIPWPIVFWACTAEEGTKFTVNPFDRVNLGYDGLFGPRTMFYHLEPRLQEGGRLVERIDVPVLDSNVISHGMVDVMTMALVLSGFLWVAWKVLREVQWEMNWWKSPKAQKQLEKKAQ